MFDAGADDQIERSATAPEPAPAPRPAGLFDAGDADVLDVPSAPASQPVRAAEPEPEPEPVAPEEPVQVPAPEESFTEELPATDDSSADDSPGDDSPPDDKAAGDPDPTPARPAGSGFFDLPDEPESEPRNGGRRRRGWGRR
ncbi:MAG: hypothetical protein V9E94_20560 [Microthrixaceae bacterium]